jgi:hypothetical protein
MGNNLLFARALQDYIIKLRVEFVAKEIELSLWKHPGLEK